MATKPAHSCVSNQILNNKYKIVERLGEGLEAQIFRGCRIGPDQECTANSKLAIKKILITQQAYSYRFYNESFEALSFAVWAELYALQLCAELVQNNVCPNLPSECEWYICDNCPAFEFPNQAISDKNKDSHCVYICNKFASLGSLQSWLQSHHSDYLYSIAMFQVLSALYALFKQFDMTHEDLHPGNILVHEDNYQTSTYTKYRIDGNVFYIPNTGLLFCLWDFSMARIPNVMEPENLLTESKEPIERSSWLKYRSIADHYTFIKELLFNKDFPTVIPERVQEFFQSLMRFPLKDTFEHFDQFKKLPSGYQQSAEFEI